MLLNLAAIRKHVTTISHIIPKLSFETLFKLVEPTVVKVATSDVDGEGSRARIAISTYIVPNAQA